MFTESIPTVTLSVTSITDSEQKLAITQLLKAKNAILLAHYYQVPEIQELAHFVGDSLALARKARETDADIIVLAGVHFMAETAKILNPTKKVLLPDLNAGCSLADSCPPESFRSFVDAHPDHVVVSYVNCSAEVKVLSDIVCTSGNAVQVIESIPREKPIIFAPDKNLGAYLMNVTGRDMLLWDGACTVHEAFGLEKIIDLKLKHPDAVFIAHPESRSEILQLATYIGSTAGMLAYVQQSEYQKFIVATEVGIMHEMQKAVPHKTLIPAPAYENNSCACSECAFMKVNTLQKLYDCLQNESPEIVLGERVIERAAIPIERMLSIPV